jgi:acyl carrier protein
VTEQEVKTRLHDFILDVFFLTEATQLTDDVSLIESGIVDSTGILDIILFIEDEFGVEVGDQEAIPDNLESINQIAAFVERKQGVLIR